MDRRSETSGSNFGQAQAMLTAFENMRQNWLLLGQTSYFLRYVDRLAPVRHRVAEDQQAGLLRKPGERTQTRSAQAGSTQVAV